MKKDYNQQISIFEELYFHTCCPRLTQKQGNDDAGTLELLNNCQIPRQIILLFDDSQFGEAPGIAQGTAADRSNCLAMIHANPSQLRVIVNEQNLFDHPMQFSWQCSQVERNRTKATYFYDEKKSSYLRGYNPVQEFFGKRYGNGVSINARDSCSNSFMIPLNLHLDFFIDTAGSHGNFTIDYQLTAITIALLPLLVMRLPRLK